MFTSGSWLLPETRWNRQNLVEQTPSSAKKPRNPPARWQSIVEAVETTTALSPVAPPKDAPTQGLSPARNRAQMTLASLNLGRLLQKNCFVFCCPKALKHNVHANDAAEHIGCQQFIPGSPASSGVVFQIDRKQRDEPWPFKRSVPTCSHENKGRQLPLVLECLLTAGQRHIRLTKGWAEMCAAKVYSVAKTVRLVRWEQECSLRGTRVTVSTASKMWKQGRFQKNNCNLSRCAAELSFFIFRRKHNLVTVFGIRRLCLF